MTPYTKVYSTLRSLINFILPLLVTCLFYILIYRISRNHGPKFGNNGGLSSAKQPTIDEKKVYLKNIRAAKTTSMFVVAIFFCWQPFSNFSIVANLVGLTPYPYELSKMLLMLWYLNSTLNPFLFAFRNKHFKSVFSKLRTSLKLVWLSRLDRCYIDVFSKRCVPAEIEKYV